MAQLDQAEQTEQSEAFKIAFSPDTYNSAELAAAGVFFRMRNRDNVLVVNIHSRSLRGELYPVDSEIFGRSALLYSTREGDKSAPDQEARERYDKSAVYEVDNLLTFLSDLKEAAKDGGDLYGKPHPELFIAALQKYSDNTEAVVLDEWKSGSIGFSSLYRILDREKHTSELCFSIDGEILMAGIGEPEVTYRFGGAFLEIPLTFYRRHGVEVEEVNVSHSIPSYKGRVSLSEIGIYTPTAEIKERLVARGRRYLALTESPSFVLNTGAIVRKSWWGTNRSDATGRVIIDQPSMMRIDSNYSMYLGGGRSERSRSQDLAIDMAVKEIDVNSSEVLAKLPPVVYGYSFKSKTWGEMKIGNISDIQFKEDAFDRLILDADLKKTVRALVNTSNVKLEDIVEGKGGGCIFLLDGPPGCGKTSTAETVSETLKRPLYTVSVGELGTEVDVLEANLRHILEMATNWNAVLLIDEADIFLEKRCSNDIHRNAMVGIFLRLLEYYQGILFLTTNRVQEIDTAFFSRINVAVHYQALGPSGLKSIWDNFLEDLAKRDLVEGAIDTQMLVSNWPVNGRQVKNTIRNAMAIAIDDGRKISQDDLVIVLKMGDTFASAQAGEHE